MLRDLNMPMMAIGDSSSSSSELAWDDIPSAGPADIQSGRNVYIDIEMLSESVTVTKASAGKILQFIHEGFLPVFRQSFLPPGAITGAVMCVLSLFYTEEVEALGNTVVRYVLRFAIASREFTFYAYSDALDKPFTTLVR